MSVFCNFNEEIDILFDKIGFQKLRCEQCENVAVSIRQLCFNDKKIELVRNIL